MEIDNPALDALNAINTSSVSQNESKAHSRAIVNGIRTCGPLFSAAIRYDSDDIVTDIEELISSTKSLIDAVMEKLTQSSINIAPHQQSAINAFCIKIVSENWKYSQEVFEKWCLPIVETLQIAGISAENSMSSFNTTEGTELTSNIVASAEVFCTLFNNGVIAFDVEKYKQCIDLMHSTVESAIKKLTEFHIPYEDADLVRHHLILYSSKILRSIIEREISNVIDAQRHSSINDEPSEITFSFTETFRRFEVSMDSFVTAIYTSSRMVN